MVNISSSKGNISITDEVLTYLAGDAATSCFGVKGMAGRSKDGGPLQLLRRAAYLSSCISASTTASISRQFHAAL